MTCPYLKRKGNYNIKILTMKKNAEQKIIPAVVSHPSDSTDQSKAVDTEAVVIYDECGDTMWDAVLAQENRVCGLNPPRL
jgi:hypothetical protein